MPGLGAQSKPQPLSWSGTFLLRHCFHRGHLRPSFNRPIFPEHLLCARPWDKKSVTLLELCEQFTGLTVSWTNVPRELRLYGETDHSTQ